jgi:hypothetical protein
MGTMTSGLYVVSLTWVPLVQIQHQHYFVSDCYVQDFTVTAKDATVFGRLSLEVQQCCMCRVLYGSFHYVQRTSLVLTLLSALS